MGSNPAIATVSGSEPFHPRDHPWDHQHGVRVTWVPMSWAHRQARSLWGIQRGTDMRLKTSAAQVCACRTSLGMWHSQSGVLTLSWHSLLGCPGSVPSPWELS